MYSRMAVITGAIILLLGIGAIGEASQNSNTSLGNSSGDTETLKGT